MLHIWNGWKEKPSEENYGMVRLLVRRLAPATRNPEKLAPTRIMRSTRFGGLYRPLILYGLQVLLSRDGGSCKSWSDVRLTR